MSKEIHKWFLNFGGNNVITPEDHIYAVVVELLNLSIEHEYVMMRILEMSLIEYAQRWFKGMLDNHLVSYDYFTKFLKIRC